MQWALGIELYLFHREKEHSDGFLEEWKFCLRDQEECLLLIDLTVLENRIQTNKLIKTKTSSTTTTTQEMQLTSKFAVAESDGSKWNLCRKKASSE